MEETIEKLEAKMKLLLLPTDPNDNRNVMLEIRAGTGGDEAALWAAELLGVYKKYAQEQVYCIECRCAKLLFCPPSADRWLSRANRKRKPLT